MPYEKQNFEDGQVLTAENLNHMEDGIGDAEKSCVSAKQGSENKKTLLYVDDDGNVVNAGIGEDIEVLNVKGKNLVYGEWVCGKYNASGFVPITNGLAFATINQLYHVTPGGTYTASIVAKNPATGYLNLYIWEYDADGNSVRENTEAKGTFGASNARTFTVADNTAFIAFFLYCDSKQWQDVIPEGFMIEAGSVKTEYEPYRSGTYTLSVKNKTAESITTEAFAEHIPSATVKTIAHRGDPLYAPQCTAPAYIVARKYGHTIMENDLMLADGGKLVMWHDTTLNRLGNLVDINGYIMYTDGTNYYWVNPANNAVYTFDTDYVASSVALSTLTRCNGANYGVNADWADVTQLPFEVLRRIDFGVWFDEKYKGTQILTFEEWVILCKQLGADIYIDHKLKTGDDGIGDVITEAANIVKKYGMGDHASWLLSWISDINRVRGVIPDARIGILAHPDATKIQTYASVNTGRGFFFNGDAKNGMTAEAIQLGLSAGYDVEVWYVEYGSATEETIFNKIREAVSYGVTAITTDHYRVDEAFQNLLEQY